MSDRLITDNILVAFETLHHLKHKRKGKTGFMTLELDMSKAYYRVEWEYLEKVMMKIGFTSKMDISNQMLYSFSFFFYIA